MSNIFVSLVRISCPKCGFSILHEATEENKLSCENCNHAFDWRKRRNEEIIQRFKKPFTLDDPKDVALSRDVYVGGEFDSVSMHRGMPGSVYVGRISGDPFDNVVRDHSGFIQGVITSTGHFASHGL